MTRFPVRRFLRVVVELGPSLYYLLSYRKSHLGVEPSERETQKLAQQGRKLFDKIVRLGPAFIKLGQILSVRPDVVPPEYIRELERLQDDVPPAPFDAVEKTIVQQLGPIESVFDRFDNVPVASASLGQVYRAVYKGTDVAVKVNRPGILQQVKADVDVLRALLKLLGVFVDRNIAESIRAVVDEYAARVQDEVDYTKEARNMKILGNALKETSWVIVPEVFADVSTSGVLVMRYVDGIKVTDVKELDRIGVDRARLARRLARLFLKMVLTQPVFHADPHPGNIAVTQDGKIILYDYGIVGSLSESTRDHIIRLYTAMGSYDPGAVVDELYELGALDPGADRGVIEKGFELAFRELRGENVSQWEIKRFRLVADRMISTFPFRLPDELVLYMRMATILEAVCTTLDPNFRFVRVMSNVLEEEGYMDKVRRENIFLFIKKVSDSLSALLQLSPLMVNTLKQAQLPSESKKRSKTLLLVPVAVFVASLFTRAMGYSYSYYGFVAAFFIVLILDLRN